MVKEFAKKNKNKIKGQEKKVLMKIEKVDGKEKEFYLHKIKGNEVYWNDYISRAIIFNNKSEIKKCIIENYALLRESNKIYVVEVENKIKVKK